LKYRAEIDGLRAIAVIPVILFHAGFELFGGGFVGVDVFFVISGYLITTILVKDLENKRFSIINFYERRARRILPSLFFIILLTLIFSLLYLPPHALKDLGQSILAVSVFLSNFFFYIEQDYFANTAELAPLLHTWSLAVEEQFYLIFPFVLLILSKSSMQTMNYIIFSFVLISLIAAEWIVGINPQMSFFMPFTRFWEILIGSLIAINSSYFNRIKSAFYCDFFSILGLTCILFSILTFNSETKFPGMTALIPVFGTTLVIIFANQSTFIGKLLSGRIIVSIGLLSYSLYLSHNVVFALSRNIAISLSSISIQFILISFSILLSLASYFLIEKPLRYINLKKNFYLAYSIIIIIFFTVIGYTLHKTDGLKKWKLENLSTQIKQFVIDANYESDKRSVIDSMFLPTSGEPFDKSLSTHNILILGDSKSNDLYVSIISNYIGNTYQFRRFYLDDTDMQGDISNNLVSTDLKLVVNSQTFKEADEIILTATWQRSSNSGVIEFIKFLKNQGKKISIVSTSNFNDVASLSYVIAKRKIMGVEVDKYLFKQIRQDWRRQYLELKRTLEQLNFDVQFFDKIEAFCDFEIKQCSLKDSDGWYIYDSGHLTANGIKYFGNYMFKNWFKN